MKKVIKVLNYIDIQMENKFKEELASLNPDEIEEIIIYIDSQGGEFICAYNILQLLEPFEDKITTVALSYCMSAATMLFLIGRKRLVINECKFIMHRPAVCTDNISNVRFSINVLRGMLESLKENEKFMKEFYKEHNVPRSLISEIFNTEEDYLILVGDLLATNMATGICEVEFMISQVQEI